MSLIEKFALVALCSLLSVLPAGAQGKISFNFAGEITSVQDPSTLLEDGVEVGDVFTGCFNVDDDIVPFYHLTTTATFGLNGGLGKVSIEINDKTFEHLSTANPQPDDEIFTLFQTSYRQGEPSNWFNCYHQIAVTSKNNTFPGNPPAAGTSIQLNLNNFDCDFEMDVVKPLDQFTPERWDGDSRTLWLTAHDGGVILYRIGAIITSVASEDTEFSKVSGNIFGDIGADCERNAGDPSLSERTITFTPGNYFAISKANGEYQTVIPQGQYQATVSEHPLWLQHCPTAPADIIADSEELTFDFGLQPTQALEALDISLGSSRPARPGFALTYTIRIKNVGTLPYNGQIRLRHDPVLLDFSSEPAAADYSAPNASWNIANLPIDETLIITASFRVPPDEKLLGTVICAIVESDLNDKSNDEILRQSQDEICQEIRGAYDPNDIQVFTGTRSADGPITQDQKILKYLIRFQNEGNEDAITVRVVDKLTEFHRIDKLRLGASSHDYVFNFTDDGELEWTFNDINLPPKERDEPGSNGFIKFEVFLKDELAIGTEIPNSAAIYFDFNSPVITNTVVSRVTSPAVSVNELNNRPDFEVFPNPANDKLTLKFEQAQHAEVVLMNSLGQEVKRQVDYSSIQNVDLTDLPPGQYYLLIRRAQSQVVKSVIHVD